MAAASPEVAGHCVRALFRPGLEEDPEWEEAGARIVAAGLRAMADLVAGLAAASEEASKTRRR